jgi:hypothetical protein
VIAVAGSHRIERYLAWALMNKMADAGNTMIPALLVLEKIGFTVSMDRSIQPNLFRATRADEIYVAEDPLRLLGLVKLIEVRTWDWRPSDAEIREALRQYELGGSS